MKIIESKSYFDLKKLAQNEQPQQPQQPQQPNMNEDLGKVIVTSWNYSDPEPYITNMSLSLLSGLRQQLWANGKPLIKPDTNGNINHFIEELEYTSRHHIKKVDIYSPNGNRSWKIDRIDRSNRLDRYKDINTKNILEEIRSYLQKCVPYRNDG